MRLVVVDAMYVGDVLDHVVQASGDERANRAAPELLQSALVVVQGGFPHVKLIALSALKPIDFN